MAWCIQKVFEDAVWAAAEKVVGKKSLAQGKLIPAIQSRSMLYTEERGELAVRKGRAEESDMAARAVFFTVCDAAKVLIPMTELERAGVAPRDEVRVLDLGAGAGAMTMGLWSWFAQRSQAKLKVSAIDSDPRALDIFAHWVREVSEGGGTSVELKTTTGDVTAPLNTEERFDLILAGTVFNELPEKTRLTVIERAMNVLAPGGSFVIIEPALRDTSRELHILRDSVLEREIATVFAPCIRQKAPCPALENASDWCHEDRKTDLTPRAARLSHLSGLRRHGLKFSYLTLRKDNTLQVPMESDGLVRVVSRLQKSKGARECFVCGNKGRSRVRLLKRNIGEGNRCFAEAQRGDVMHLSPDLSAEPSVSLFALRNSEES